MSGTYWLIVKLDHSEVLSGAGGEQILPPCLKVSFLEGTLNSQLHLSFYMLNLICLENRHSGGHSYSLWLMAKSHSIPY